MASWIGVTTNAGARLMANWTNGSVITVNKAVAGTGVVSAVSLLAQTDLVGEKQNASIVSSKAENDTQKIKIQIQAPEEGYVLNQIGIFACLDDGDQVLIALFQNDTGIPIPSTSESPDFVYTFYSYLTVSNQIEFSCIIDPAAYVSQSTMQEYVRTQLAIAAETAQTNLSNHNTDTKAHADLRASLQKLSDWVKDLLDCDDETLNETHEIVAYIKSNKSLIDAITTSKVSVSDIVNDLVTNVTDKPLSAAQGVAIKALIDTLQTAVDNTATNTQANLDNHNTDTKAHADLRASLKEVLDTITAAQAKLDNHNTDTEAHADIRAALQELSDWVKDLLDCDDETLNEMHEVVEYIKSNRSLLESITTSKVSVTDIVNDLVTNVANKPLSAAQGVALKTLIDTLQKTVDDNHSQLSSEIANLKTSTEPWTFTVEKEDGSTETVTKEVFVK